MDLINFYKLYSFYVVAKEGSIKSASEKLHLSQPSVSVQIKTLEEEIGFKVFNRKHNKITLNEHGLALLNRAEKLFQIADDLVSDLPSLGTRQVENFKVGVLRTISSLFISEFSNVLWGNTSFFTTVDQCDKETLNCGLDSARFDFILSDEPSKQDNRYTSIKLKSAKLVVASSKTFAKQVKSFPASLNGMPYIAFPNGVKTQEDVNYFFSRNNISPKVIGRLDDILLIKQITENGFCFCVVPEHVVEHNFNSTKLVRLGEVPNLSFDLWGIFPRISADRVLVKTIIRDYFDL